ncbi:N-acetylneuraminate synthase family protein [Gordonia hongkongensis]|uniref:N-acetylneuraminate synthase family protein n=1 Tax=Gordonia hongkongensis TaxID=1701090 RepID=A0AAX3TBH6_9ACTN|nr:N-acetylneuraminate synthase family protein [Gordonia hongkongensis]QIK49164.1 N-acetylneuraminate synthase [Gordonia terrae]WFP25927.1 N-acetylneuraminate synthase family protein [Gordonia hongkongensis]
MENHHSGDPYVIAEIGCNHAGDLEFAKKMISVAKNFCEVDAVKFQKRDNKTLLTESQYNAPHPNPMHSFGDTYGAHREYLEFSYAQHLELQEYCAKENIEYSTSVWDVPSAEMITSVNPRFIKVPSACNLNFELLGTLCDDYAGDIHISLGMTTSEEETQIVRFLDEKGRLRDCVLYACTSGYPVPFDQLALMEVKRLNEAYGDKVKDVGFSGHHLGIAADVAAMALGATVVERHFTLDRTSKGTDHSASLEPDGMRRLKRDLSNVSRAMTYKDGGLLPIESPTRDKLKWQEQ